MAVKGWFASGWIHQTLLFEYKTIRWPGFAPVALPSIETSLKGLPSAAGGILVNSIEGWRGVQLAASIPTRSTAIREVGSSLILAGLSAQIELERFRRARFSTACGHNS